MRTLGEAIDLFWRGSTHGAGLPADDVRRVLEWADSALKALERLTA